MLTRKSVLSWARGSTRRSEAEPGGIGGVGQAAWLPVAAGSGSGSGMRGEGDFEAEGGELADVVGDLAAGGGLALVVVRAEVLIPGAGAG
jgi:hypothetical protein